MAAPIPQIVRRAFNAGEIAPILKIRSDFEKYSSACERLENFMITPQGAVRRRRGTQFLADLSASDHVRIIPFEYNRTQSAILAFRIANGATTLDIFDTDGTPRQAGIPTSFPTSAAALNAVQYLQVNDVIYFTHPEMPPQRLERRSDGTFAFVERPIKIEPILDVEEEGLCVEFNLPQYDSAQKYDFGEVVMAYASSPVVMSGMLNATSEALPKLYLQVRLNVATHNIAVGDEIPVNMLKPIVFKSTTTKEGAFTTTTELSVAPETGLGKVVRVNGSTLYVSAPLRFTTKQTLVEEIDEAAMSENYNKAAPTVNPKWIDEPVFNESFDAGEPANVNTMYLVRGVVNEAYDSDAETLNPVWVDDGDGNAVFNPDYDPEAETVNPMYVSAFARNGGYDPTADTLNPMYVGAMPEMNLNFLPAESTLNPKWTARARENPDYDSDVDSSNCQWVDGGGGTPVLNPAFNPGMDEVNPRWITETVRNAAYNPEESTINEMVEDGRPVPNPYYDANQPTLNPKWVNKTTFSESETSVDTDGSYGEAVPNDYAADLPQTVEFSAMEDSVIFATADVEIGGVKATVAHYVPFYAAAGSTITLRASDVSFSGDVKGAFCKGNDASGYTVISEFSLVSEKSEYVLTQDCTAVRFLGTFVVAGLAKIEQDFYLRGHYEFTSTVKGGVLPSPKASFYASLDHNNRGHALTDTRFWERQYFYGGQLDVWANRDVFSAEHVGTTWCAIVDNNQVVRDSWGTNTKGWASLPFVASGTVILETQGGIWDGTLELQQSYDLGTTWEPIGTITSVDGNKNEKITRDIEGASTMVRVYMRERGTANQDSGCKWILTIQNELKTYFRITAVNPPQGKTATNEAQAQMITPLPEAIYSTDVYRGAWGGGFGYPRCVALHEERLVFGGNLKKPTTLWLSATNNWDRFMLGDLDTDALAFTLSSDQAAAINYISSRGDMIILTDISEWSLGAHDGSEALTASQVRAVEQTRSGSEYVQAVKAGHFLIFVKRGSERLAAVAYDYMQEGYEQTDLSVLAPHILKGDVSSIFNSASPDDVVWVVRGDGSVATFTYDKANGVSAWARHTIGDGVMSACAISTGRFKDLFFVVRRGNFLVLETIDADGTNYVDCARKNATPPEGLETDVAFESTLITTALVWDKRVRVSEVRLYLVDSFTGRVRLLNDMDEAGEWQQPKALSDTLTDEIETGDMVARIPVSQGFQDGCKVEIRADSPAPFTLSAIGCNIQRF